VVWFETRKLVADAVNALPTANVDRLVRKPPIFCVLQDYNTLETA
jgi:hypothetical protein